MRRRVFVISDLHLGGEPGFQCYSPDGASHLAEFIRFVASHLPERVELVLAGDIVDFLAEPPWQAFTSTEADAVVKLERIVGRSLEFWRALRDANRGGVVVTLLLGNHDIELSFPRSRQLLRQIAGDVRFLVDGEAFTMGPLLIEHGNRYDPWNIVPYGDLRAVRSALSRREAPPPIPEIPGSKLVVEVMNDLKRKFRFIDLLKPEACVIPILAYLEPGSIASIRRVFDLFHEQRRTKFRDGTPLNIRQIGARDVQMFEESKSVYDEAFTYASKLTGIDHPVTEIGTRGGARLLGHDVRIQLLARALMHLAQADHSFSINTESPRYLNAARRSFARGFRVVVYGHTHLAKFIQVEENYYINSGTWVDLIQVPADLATKFVNTAAIELFLTKLQDGSNRELRSTFVDIEMVDHIVLPRLKEFRADGTVQELDR